MSLLAFSKLFKFICAGIALSGIGIDFSDFSFGNYLRADEEIRSEKETRKEIRRLRSLGATENDIQLFKTGERTGDSIARELKLMVQLLGRIPKEKAWSEAEKQRVDVLESLDPEKEYSTSSELTTIREAMSILVRRNLFFQKFSPELKKQILWGIENATSGKQTTMSRLKGRKALELYGEIPEVGRYAVRFVCGSGVPGMQRFKEFVEIDYPPEACVFSDYENRSPALNPFTGKPYLSFPKGVLSELSPEDKEYALFFAECLNDCIHYHFGRPLYPNSMQDWVAGKYISKMMFYPEFLPNAIAIKNAKPAWNRVYEDLSCSNPFAASTKKISLRLENVTLREAVEALNVRLEKSVFFKIDPAIENVKVSVYVGNSSALQVLKHLTESRGYQYELCENGEIEISRQKPRRETSDDCLLLPCWGVSEGNAYRFWYPSIPESIYVADESGSPQIQRFSRCNEKRINLSVEFLKQLRRMRETLIARDYSTPEAVNSPKGKAMLSLFERCRKLEAEFSKIIDANTDFSAKTIEKKYHGYASNPWTLLDPKGKTKKQYFGWLREYEKKFPPILRGEPLIVEKVKREQAQNS